MRITIIDDRTVIEQINVGTRENPDITISGKKERTITIDCDDEAGDLIIEYVRDLAARA